MVESRLIKILRRLSVALVVIFVLMGLGYLVTGPEIVVDVSEAPSAISTNVYIDGKMQLNFNEKSKSYTFKGLRGSKKIVVKSAGNKDYETTVTALFKGKKVVKPTFTELPAAELAAKLDPGIENRTSYDITSPEYYDNRQWLVFTLSLKTDPKTAPIFIARYDRMLGDWVVLNYGGAAELELGSNDYRLPDAIYDKYLRDQ